MLYLEVNWIKPTDKEPVQLFSEMNQHRAEARKVEIFADGTMGFADRSKTSHGTRLSITPVSSIAAINACPEFACKPIERDRFERFWHRAKKDAPD